MYLRWLPWKFLIRRLAKSHGLIDPVRFMSRFNKFAQPSEVAAPVELFRASLVFYARGLINARTIQTNLDWVWPFWIERQFDPRDTAFVPRSYTLSHVNLTHRNWTAVGLPDCDALPVIDPRGMVTPFYDGWSIDGWLIAEDGTALLPPSAPEAEQRLVIPEARDALFVETVVRKDGLKIRSVTDVVMEDGTPFCRIRYTAESSERARFAVALRPCNPEGVSAIHEIEAWPDAGRWTVNGVRCVTLNPPTNALRTSTFEDGDVFIGLSERPDADSASCNAGMATAAALYDVSPAGPMHVEVRIDLSRDPETPTLFPAGGTGSEWKPLLDKVCRLDVPDERIRFLFDTAVASLILHSPLDIYPGPFYYKRFWFRDAVFILNALLAVGLHDRSERLLDEFPSRQGIDGYFRSQHGEWDSNGQVMWIFDRFRRLTGRPCKPEWLKAIIRAGRWIERKRTGTDLKALHAGLLPAGFSAEHLGHNDYYYWDDLWSVAGLHAGERCCRAGGEERQATLFGLMAKEMMLCVERSIARSRHIRKHDGIPASPYRRMDAGAIGSIIAGYPLRLWPGDDTRLLATVDFLMEKNFIDNAFFQDMFHSGFNVYLSLHCAQVLLRAGDRRFFPIINKMAELASPTGQWPEAIHPHTLGGCQGDGQHIWAAAEWVLMLRNIFAREEGDRLMLLQGVPEKWLQPGQKVKMGPIHTAFGPITVEAAAGENSVDVRWDADWREVPSAITIAPEGTEAVDLTDIAAQEPLITLRKPKLI